MTVYQAISVFLSLSLSLSLSHTHTLFLKITLRHSHCAKEERGAERGSYGAKIPPQVCLPTAPRCLPAYHLHSGTRGSKKANNTGLKEVLCTDTTSHPQEV